MPGWQLLPETLIQEELDEEAAKERQLGTLEARLHQLENELARTRTSQFGQALSVGGFEINTSTIMFGVIIGLVVYVLVSEHYEKNAPQRQWWQW